MRCFHAFTGSETDGRNQVPALGGAEGITVTTTYFSTGFQAVWSAPATLTDFTREKAAPCSIGIASPVWPGSTFRGGR